MMKLFLRLTIVASFTFASQLSFTMFPFCATDTNTIDQKESSILEITTDASSQKSDSEIFETISISSSPTRHSTSQLFTEIQREQQENNPHVSYCKRIQETPCYKATCWCTKQSYLAVLCTTCLPVLCCKNHCKNSQQEIEDGSF